MPAPTPPTREQSRLRVGVERSASARVRYRFDAALAVLREHEAVGPIRIVAELLDQQHAALAGATGADGFIVSDELTSLMLAQLAERLDLHEILTDLFDSGGCTIELRQAASYGATRAATFAQIVATASSRWETAFGYRVAASGIVRVNPNKLDPLTLVDDDQVLSS